ncbi:SpoIIIAH-like family protein [Paenibacillus sp. NPDC058071]|uniref:SpoIIIAH-like family protein n=1 Tax=Paenibacillus sp. NPDC058071 TaxID=3346326 RepID=UPI0036D7C195
MNTKRQTIWLVSMLSLMVVLSAYYLFTQDGDSPNLASDGAKTQETAGNNGAEAASGKKDPLVVNEVLNPETGGKTELDVLKELEKSGGAVASVFANSTDKQRSAYDEQRFRLLEEVSNDDPDKAQAAIKELEQLDDRYGKINSIESELSKDFHTAIVNEENNQFKVIVESEKLEKTQAVAIIDLVMKTLDVNADQVSVQFVH